MEWIRKNLIMVLVIVACIVGFIIYHNYFSGSDSGEILVSDTSLGASDLLQSLSDLKSINFDATIFADPVFASLVDFGINIPPEPVGRSNPFAPLSGRTTQTGNAGVTPTTVKATH